MTQRLLPNLLLRKPGGPGSGLGDITVLTGLARDLALTYPGQYRLMVDTAWSRLWDHNPYIVPLDAGHVDRVIEPSYQTGINLAKSGQKLHFLAWMYRDFTSKTGIKLAPRFPHGDLHLAGAELQPSVTGRYWLVVAGGKLDMTVKHWRIDRWQQLVDSLAGLGIACVQVGATHRDHVHPALTGVLNAVGYTENLRDLLTLLRHADGVICGVTGIMHLAACLQKPCVVLAGGREEPWWEAYTDAYQAFGPACARTTVAHRYLHTLNLLHCCTGQGCWKKRIVPIEPKDLGPDGALCKEPVRTPGLPPVAKCLEMITVEHVLDAVMSYYEDRMLPPIAPPSGNYPAAPAPVPALTLPAPLAFTRPPTVPAKAQGPLQRQAPTEYPTHGLTPGQEAMDHPYLGGRVTVCVLCYGNYPELARRCLDSIYRTVPAARLDVRVATNACAPATLAYLRGLPLSKLYEFPDNRGKAAAMRALWHDPELPLATPYTLWFDDDSYVVDPQWLGKLAQCIVANHPMQCRLYGIRFIHDLKSYHVGAHDPNAWFKAATWWRGKDWAVRGRETSTSPNGSVIPFVAGGFLALATDVIGQQDIPDPRLRHNGIDVALGAQVYQAGWKLRDFNRSKVHVFSSGAPRRGLAEAFPWADPGSKHKFQKAALP